MKIQFTKGTKIFNDDNRKFICLGMIACTGVFMNRTTSQWRYKNKIDLERITDNNETFIYVVKQDNWVETFKTVLHELAHFIVFKLFNNSKKLDDFIDKIDS